MDKHAHEHPLCNQLMKDFARPEVLYLAGLFHDIAKGRGGDHSALGKMDAARFCRQHDLPREDRELVTWLVAQHLAFSKTAQSRDLTDPDVIAEFAATMPSERHLVALYLLTVADIQGTNPKIWNAWKSQLLESLFAATRRHQAGGQQTDSDADIRARAAEKLDIPATTRDAFWAQLDTSYFLQHDADEITWHTRQLAPHLHAATPIVKARVARIGKGLQVMVYCPDQPYLFARICHFFATMRFSIMEARVHVTRHGYALDSFLVMDPSKGKAGYRDAIHRIEHELARQIAAAEPLPAPPTGRADRQLRHFPIAPQVEIEADGKGGYRLSLIAGDYPGLLARIARVLAQHRIDLFSARINTLGARAEDVLHIRGEELAVPEKIEALRGELLRQMGEEAQRMR
jgi:[protein-PII] uridylyltransferase